MPLSDIELIQRTLAGDETAFGFLVDKYKGTVHALAYRKLGDFQLAEEIAQDTFLAAYQKLGTLRNRARFPGWLYVIASRLCLMWQRKNKLQVHLNEDMETGEIDAVALRRYAEKQLQHQIRDALDGLPESERTVLTLHYLAGMTCKEIGQFIGASPSAVQNRLYRARARLKEEIIPVLRSTLGVIQLPPTFTEQLVRQIRELQPTPASSGKPMLPWITATTLAVIVLFIGFGHQQTTWFQRPYSLNAPESATMVEIVDAPVIESLTSQRLLFVQSASLNAGDAGNGDQIDDANSRNAMDSATQTATAHGEWTPMNGPYGGTILSLLVTQEGTVFAGTDKAYLFRSTNRGESWTRIHTPLDHLPGRKRLSALTEIEDTLYAVGSYVVSSMDGGDSWIVDSRFEEEEDSYCGIAIVDDALYVGSWEQGVLRSDDGGQTWTPINEGLTVSSNPQSENTQSVMWAHAINTFRSDGQTLYVGTDSGAFQRKAGDDRWEPLHKFIPTDVMSGLEQPVEVNPPSSTQPFSSVRSLAVEGEEFYIATLESLYHSSDGGTSWEQIPGTHFMRGMISSIAGSGKIVYVGEYVRGVFRSTDDGRSWTPVNAGITDSIVEDVEGLNGMVYAIKGWRRYNIARSDDGGTSWATIDDGLRDEIYGKIRELVVSEGTLYAAFDSRPGLIYQWEETTDSWLQVASHTQLAGISSLTVDGNVFYAGTCRNGVLRSTDGGESWVNVGLEGKRINVLAAHRMTIYAGTEGEGIFRLENGTHSWKQLGVSSSIQRVKELAVSGGILYVAGITRGARVPGDSGGTADQVINGVLRSFDGGDTWEKVSTGLEVGMGISSLAVYNSTLYAGAKTRVYRLLPGTDSWELVSPRFPDMPSNVRCLGIEGKTLYAGTGGAGVFKFSLDD